MISRNILRKWLTEPEKSALNSKEAMPLKVDPLISKAMAQTLKNFLQKPVNSKSKKSRTRKNKAGNRRLSLGSELLWSELLFTGSLWVSLVWLNLVNSWINTNNTLEVEVNLNRARMELFNWWKLLLLISSIWQMPLEPLFMTARTCSTPRASFWQITLIKSSNMPIRSSPSRWASMMTLSQLLKHLPWIAILSLSPTPVESKNWRLTMTNSNLTSTNTNHMILSVRLQFYFHKSQAHFL